MEASNSVFKALGSENVSFRFLVNLYLTPEMNMRCPVDDGIVQIDEDFPDPNSPYLFTSYLRSRHRKVSICIMCLIVPSVSAGSRSVIAYGPRQPKYDKGSCIESS